MTSINGIPELRLTPSPTPWIRFRSKQPEQYSGIPCYADIGLHEQLSGLIVNIAAGRKLDILDWGCGRGAFSQRLHDQGHRVRSVDMDAAAFNASGPRFDQVNFNDPAQVENFVESSRSGFDVVVCAEVIEHVRDPWQLVGTIRTLLRPGGTLLLTTPNIGSSLSRLKFLVTGSFLGFSWNAWDFPGHINPIGTIELVRMLRGSGFNISGMGGGGCLPVIWAGDGAFALLASLAALPLRPFMRGAKNGWVLVVLAQRQD
jgi:2-polyprenyl-3-methyl-5-hydroxy-6-metoxy-1,4-benzoquinol methylase